MIKVSKTVLICPSYNKKEKIYNLKRSYIFLSFIVSVILIVLHKTIDTTTLDKYSSLKTFLAAHFCFFVSNLSSTQ